MLYGRDDEDTGVCEYCGCALDFEGHDLDCPVVLQEIAQAHEDDWREEDERERRAS